MRQASPPNDKADEDEELNPSIKPGGAKPDRHGGPLRVDTAIRSFLRAHARPLVRQGLADGGTAATSVDTRSAGRGLAGRMSLLPKKSPPEFKRPRKGLYM